MGDVIALTEELRVGDDVRVLLSDIKMVTPALDCNPDETLLVTVPLPGIRTVEDRKGNPTDRGEMVLCTVTSKPEIFETSQKEFMKRKWIAQIPNPIIEQRWSAACIKSFLGGTAPQVSPWEVFCAIRERFDHYMDFGEDDYNVDAVALYTFSTYYYFLFEVFPYLKLGGEKGSAKTKCGSLMAYMGFNGQISASWTRALVYRFAQDTRGCMVIDEAEGLQYRDEERAAFIEILNSGFQSNGFAILVDKETMRPIKYSSFCPKVICSIGGLEEVLGDRAFEIILMKTFDAKKGNRQAKAASKEWRPIRDSEYLCLFQHWKEVKQLEEAIENEFGFSGRVWDLAKPLMTMARFVNRYRPQGSSADLEASLKRFIEEQAREKIVKAKESFGSTVVAMLHEMAETAKRDGSLDPKEVDSYLRVDLNELTERVKEAEGFKQLYPRTVAGVLGNLKLYKDVRRDGHNGSRRFGFRESELKEAESRLVGRRSGTTTDDTDATDSTDARIDWAKTPPSQIEHESGADGRSIPPSVASGASVPSVIPVQGQPPASPGGSDRPTPTQLKTFSCADCGRVVGDSPSNPKYVFRGRGAKADLCREDFERRKAATREAES
jgi:hypothetical protein